MTKAPMIRAHRPLIGDFSHRPALTVILESLAISAAVVATGIGIARLVIDLVRSNYANDRDFAAYWSASRQLLHHANPYDMLAVSGLERSIGFSRGFVLVMRNPPNSLMLVLPLCSLSAKHASLLWVFLLVVSLVVSIFLLSSIYPHRHRNVGFLGFLFAPALCCLMTGQVGLFVLLGLVLFLRFHDSNPLTAGAALWLCAVKPHLFLPLCTVLIMWAITSKSFKLLAGAAITIATSCIISTSVDHSVWTQYVKMIKSANLEQQLIPCLSTVLRHAIDWRLTWLQFIPTVLGCIWAAMYFLRTDRWSWIEHGPVLILVSVLVAPYSWFPDQAILLPAIFQVLHKRPTHAVVAALAMLCAVFETAILIGVRLDNFTLFPWTAGVWLVWYLCASYSFEFLLLLLLLIVSRLALGR